MTSAALLLLVSGPQALAEDEPAARAPLPPLLQGAPAEAGERQMRDPAPSRIQSDPGTPAARFDGAKPQLSQKKPRPHSASYLANSVAKKRQAPARLSMNTASGRQGHRAVASEKTQRRDRSRAEPAIGQLSPPRAPIESTTQPPAEPRQAPPLYYPNYFAGPPAYGYAPSYPYAWAPPGPGVFR